MRITNKIMHNNSIYNINNNKVTEDGLNTQIATGKKLTRPSDDPEVKYLVEKKNINPKEK